MASKEYNPADTAKQTGAISAIEIFQPLIIRAVNAEELIASPKLKQIIGDDVVKGLRRSKTPNDQRVNTILELISQSASLDKWETFAGVLTDCDFTFVPLVIIKHYPSSVELQLRNVVDKLKDETVDTTLLSGFLKTNSLLTDIDVQDIDTERINRHCEKAALLVLIDRVVTFHPDSWYQNFLEYLCKSGMEGAVKKIDPDFGACETMSDTKHNKEMMDVTTDDHWRKLIMELCYEQIVKNVTPTGLLTNLSSVFNMDEKRTIRSLEKTESPQEAMAKLLNILDEKDCAGKWQIFKQALVEDDYEWIKDFIEGNFICYSNSDTWEHLINLFERTLSEKIRPLEILPYMRQEKIISDIDSQEVEQMCRNYGENQAVFGLLTFLPKRKPNSWYPEFMEILFKTGCEETVGEIDPDIYKKLIRKHRIGTSASEENGNNTDIDSLKEGADKNMDESDIKENYVSVTEEPETTQIDLCSEQDPLDLYEVRDTCSRTMSILNTDIDDEITKQKLLEKTKLNLPYNMLSESQTQPDSGQTELNSIIVENTKREIANEVSRSQEDKRNIVCSLPKKKSVDILTTLSEDDEQRYLWQFILDTKTEEVELEFRKHNISLSVDYETQQYILTFDLTNTNVKDDISKIFLTLSYRLKTVHKVCRCSCYDHMKLTQDLRIYEKENSNDVWLVGEKDVVKVASLEIDQLNSGAHSGDTEHDLEESWENLELTEIPLTQQEQAVIHLYKLWDVEYLQKSHINVQKDEKPKFEIKIFVENNTEIKSIENELRSNLQSAATYPIYSLKQSFDANVIRFISTDPVSRYVDKKINCSSTRLVCSWYIDPSDNVVIVYAKSRPDLKFCGDTLKKAVQGDSFNVPVKWFGTVTSEIEQALSDLKAKHGHEVDAWLSSSFSTLHFISTREKAFQFEQDLKSLFVTKTLIVIKKKQHFCKELFRSLQNELEEKFHVNLTEDENNISYGWVIKGGTEYVQEVYNKMEALVDDVCTKSQCYQLDFGCPDIEMDLKEMATPSCQIAVEGVSQRSHNTIDPADDVLSHRWVLSNGNDIKIVNANYRWLYKDSTLLQITEATDKHLGKHFSLRPDEMTILLYLPKWTGNDGKEKEILKSSLDELYQGKGLERRSTCISTAYFVQEPRKLGWPAGMFLEQILLSLGRHKVVTPFIILEPCRKIFEEMSDAIQNYAAFIRNQNSIKITVKIGKLAKEECDAIVNSTSDDLRLGRGTVSATILATAGDKIQNECNEIMTRRGRKLSSTEVEMTNGYKLRCKYVFHGALVSPWNEQTFEKFVQSCLRRAEKEGITSIAFPSIGTGNLGYPVKAVARTMFQTVQTFAAERNDGCLKEVSFVIYYKDKKSLQAFQEEEKKQHEAYIKKESREKCPEPPIVQITVTGGNVKFVDQTFRQIEDRIKEKQVKMRIDPLQEPVSQDITRSDEPFEDDLSEGAVGFQDMSYSEPDNQEKWDPRNTPPARETLSFSGNEDVEMSEEGCSIKIELIERNTKGSYDDFVETLTKYGVNPKCIIWCRYTPNEVKVKLPRASDATSLMDTLKHETQYKVVKCNVEAVIDIRVKLNISMISGNVEQDSRNSNSTVGGSKSVQCNSDSRIDSKAYDKSRIKSVQNEQTINPNLFDEVEKEDDLHKYTYVPPHQASNADNTLLNCPSDSHVMTTKEGVKVFVYQGNLCYINVDCIVNSSNERMDHRSGLAGVVSEKAGQEMEKECERFMKDHGLLSPHKICVTTAGNLSHYQCVVHVCSPVWANRKTIEKFKGDLSGVVTNALVAVDNRKMGSIAIPAIGSGRRGGPTQLCFPSYIQGVVTFSTRKIWLQEVHFVDRDVHVVDMMKAAFLLHTPEKDTKIKDKLKKIPRKVKEKFMSFWGSDEPSGNIHYFEYAKNITVVICDGALFTGYKHEHIQDLVGIDTSFENSAVVIIENEIFNGSSRSAALCLQRGGNEFHRNYDLSKESQKTVGKVYYSCGDRSLKFGYVLYAIMPAFDDKALNPSAVNTYINQCFSSLLKKADKKKIKHLCMPFLVEDFSDQSLFETCVSNMMREIATFGSKRKAEHKFLIHIATNKDEKLNQILLANFGNPKSRKKHVHPDRAF